MRRSSVRTMQLISVTTIGRSSDLQMKNRGRKGKDMGERERQRIIFADKKSEKNWNDKIMRKIWQKIPKNRKMETNVNLKARWSKGFLLNSCSHTKLTNCCTCDPPVMILSTGLHYNIRILTTDENHSTYAYLMSLQNAKSKIKRSYFLRYNTPTSAHSQITLHFWAANPLGVTFKLFLLL